MTAIERRYPEAEGWTSLEVVGSPASLPAGTPLALDCRKKTAFPESDYVVLKRQVRQTRFTSVASYWVMPAAGIHAWPGDSVRANVHDCKAGVVLDVRRGD